MKKQKGITLIALVITIIVLLILAGVSISLLSGENGILTKAAKAKEENRGASVEEAKDLWLADVTTDESLETNTAQTLENLLDDLEEKKLITPEERTTIEENEEITIGDRTIFFGTGTKLEYAIARGGSTAILVSFKNNNFLIYATNELKKKSDDELMQIIVDFENNRNPESEVTAEKLYQNVGVSDFQEYRNKIESETNVSFEVLMILTGVVDEESLGFIRKPMTGTITLPDNTTAEIDNTGDSLSSQAAIYEITEDGIYTFSAIDSNGKKSRIKVNASLRENYIIKSQSNDSCFGLLDGYGTQIAITEEDNPIIKLDGESTEYTVDNGILLDDDGCITLSYESDLWNKITSLGTQANGEIVLVKNGKEVRYHGVISIPK